jgi:hypothetical protein
MTTTPPPPPCGNSLDDESSAALFSARRDKPIPSAYSSKLLNDPRVYNQVFAMKEIESSFRICLGPSLHVGDDTEASIDTVAHLDAWVALPETSATANPHGKYSRAKQPNGHARMLTCVTSTKSSEIVRMVPNLCAFVYINCVDGVEKLLVEVVPRVMARNGTLVVRVPNPLLDHVAGPLVSATNLHFKSLKLYKPACTNVLEPEVFAILQGFASFSNITSSSVAGWNLATAKAEATRADNVNKALDLIAFFHGLGLDTEEDCAVLSRKTSL